MKKLKLFMFVALFGAMSFGAFTAYDYATMSEEERFLLANIEALSSSSEGAIVNGPGNTKYCAKCLTNHTYCAGRNEKACYHTGH